MEHNSQEIKLLILDCDGVLADGKIIYSENDCESKCFSAFDGLGISLLNGVGIAVAVITGRTSQALIRRCVDLKIKHLYQGVKDKVLIAEDLIKELSIGWENVAFMGDDWNDYMLMQKVKLSATPNQAFPAIKEAVDFVAARDGGNGAVREFIEYILHSQGLFAKATEKFVRDLQGNR